jgi:hypothetical protein
MSKITLYDTLKSTYNDKKAMNKLKSQGYNLDSMLSNRNNQVWYNPNEKKILFGIKGTNALSFDDLKTDFLMGIGKLEKTDRYKDSKKILQQAKNKYQDYNVNVLGHSLGGSIAERIADKNKDKVHTLDSYYQPFKATSSNNGNAQHYRSQIDPISAFGANKKNVKTITNENKPTGILPLDLLNAHNVNAIKNSNILI